MYLRYLPRTGGLKVSNKYPKEETYSECPFCGKKLKCKEKSLGYEFHILRKHMIGKRKGEKA